MPIAELMDCKSVHESVLENFEAAANDLELSDELRSVLRDPERMLEAGIPVGLDDGRTGQYQAYAVQHSTSRGPARGGICCHPGVTLDEIKALAMQMTWQYAVLNVPFGGGMAGVGVDLPKLSGGELERLSHGYALAMRSLAGIEKDIRACDLCDGEATGRGAFHTVQAACEHLQVPLKGARVAVQGFGSVGAAAALLMSTANAVVAGASDTRGAIYSPGGMDIPKLIAHKKRSGSVVGFPGSEPITDFELLGLECEILITAGREHAIHGRNCRATRARIIAEAAGGSVTPAADRILHRQGVFLVPAILCAAGGLAISCDRSSGEADVYSRLEGVMRRSFREVLAISLARGVNMRRAAYILAVGRVAESIKGPKFSVAKNNS